MVRLCCAGHAHGGSYMHKGKKNMSALGLLVFTIGAEALDISARECRQLEERLICEIRIVLRGSESFARNPAPLNRRG